MEIEKEKRKIEFWADPDTMIGDIDKHAPKEPFAQNVEVSVLLTYNSDNECSLPETQGHAIHAMAVAFSYMLEYKGYIKAVKQITKMEIEKRKSRTPGIAFFMQEVE